jgi:hypothetical protein
VGVSSGVVVTDVGVEEGLSQDRFFFSDSFIAGKKHA